MTRGCRVSRPPKHDLMGQHRRANPRIYQPLVKKSQSPFPRNDPRALQYQGSWRAAPSLWDDSDLKSEIRPRQRALAGEEGGIGVQIAAKVAG